MRVSEKSSSKEKVAGLPMHEQHFAQQAMRPEHRLRSVQPAKITMSCCEREQEGHM